MLSTQADPVLFGSPDSCSFDGRTHPGPRPQAPLQSMSGAFQAGDLVGHFPFGQGQVHASVGQGFLGQDVSFGQGPPVRSATFLNSSLLNDDGQGRTTVESSRNVPGTRFKCTVCGSNYKTQWGLTLHMGKQHCDNPRFRCKLCDRGFTMKDHYEGHMNVHNRVKAFRCPNCPKAFAHKTSLRAHLRLGSCARQTLCP